MDEAALTATLRVVAAEMNATTSTPEYFVLRRAFDWLNDELRRMKKVREASAHHP